jgi:ParB-like chromosome segregation protein Spo0J
MSPEGLQVLVGKYLDVPLEDHPIAEIFPLLPDEELKELSKDIEAKGLLNPIQMYEDKILDGRNRYRAIKLMPSWTGKLELRWLEPYLGPNPVEYVISVNFHRRHLTGGQRAEIAAELAKFGFGENQHTAKEGAQICAPSPSPITQEQAAKLLNVSRRSVQSAKAVRDADPELAKKVKSGEISLNAAYQQIKPDPESELTPEPPKSWTAPTMNEDQPEPTNPHLNMTLIEAMTTAIEMVGNPEGLNRGELRSALARARALIDQKLEDL